MNLGQKFQLSSANDASFVDKYFCGDDDQVCLNGINQLCSVKEQVNIAQSTTAFNDDQWYYILGIASCLVYTLFFLALWSTKELQVHPLKLVMYITFCDCLVQMSYNNFARICEFEAYKLFSATLFFS